MSFPACVEAVVLAGGPVGELVPEAGEKPGGKGLLSIGGRAMARRTLDAARASSRVSATILVSPCSVDWDGVDTCVPSSERLMGSFCAGVGAVQNLEHPVLVCCGDLPFLSAEAVTDFIGRCEARPEASIWYCYLRRELSEKRFPTTRHTWAKLRDGTFCGSGMMMVRPSVVAPVREAMDSLTRSRKNMLKLASCLGWGTVFAYLFGRLTVPMAERAGLRIFGVPCAGIESPFAEVGFNVDDNAALQEARRLLGNASPAGELVSLATGG